MKHGYGVTIAALSTALAGGQSTEIPGPTQSTPVLLFNATVHTVAPGAAPLANGFVLFDGGKVVAVGPGIPDAVPADTERVDCRGGHICPGFVSMATSLGMVETLLVPATDDRTEFGRFHPESVAGVAINPDSDLLPVARAGGVLTAVSFPQGGLLSGQASAMRTDGWGVEGLLIERECGLVLRWPATEAAPEQWSSSDPDKQKERSAKDRREIDDFFDQAQAWLLAHSADPSVDGDLRFSRMRGALEGREPLFIEASSAGQVESAVLWAKRRGLQAVIVGGAGAGACAQLLRENGVGVVVLGVLRLPTLAHLPYDDSYSLPGRLVAAGVTCCIATGDDPSNDRNLRLHAATAAAHGLAREEALAAITRTPARIAGLGDSLGTIQVGKQATLLVCSGEPLDGLSTVQRAFIDGRAIDLSSRQSRLEEKYREKYRQLKGTEPEPAAQP